MTLYWPLAKYLLYEVFQLCGFYISTVYCVPLSPLVTVIPVDYTVYVTFNRKQYVFVL